MKSILAIDTSTEACSAALLVSDGKDITVYERYKIAPQKHTQLILPMIDEILAEGSKDRKSIDAIAFGRGPGAFTGLRIAAGIAQGISMAENIPVIPVSSLEALAQLALNKSTLDESDSSFVVSAIDARMGEIYWCPYANQDNKLIAIEDESLSTAETLKNYVLKLIKQTENEQEILLVGSGWTAYSEDLTLTDKKEKLQNLEGLFPRALEISQIAFKLLESKKYLEPEKAQPVYLRNNVAKKQA